MGCIMKTEYIPKIITLLAGAVVCIISIIKGMDTTYSLEILLAVLIIFYIIGCIVKKVIELVLTSNRFMKETPDSPEETEDLEETVNPEMQMQEADEMEETRQQNF